MNTLNDLTPHIPQAMALLEKFYPALDELLENLAEVYTPLIMHLPTPVRLQVELKLWNNSMDAFGAGFVAGIIANQDPLKVLALEVKP